MLKNSSEIYHARTDIIATYGNPWHDEENGYAKLNVELVQTRDEMTCAVDDDARPVASANGGPATPMIQLNASWLVMR